MKPHPHPECPICLLIEGAQGQPIALAMRDLKKAEQFRCRCEGQNHKVLWVHPHSQKGCQGFAAVPTEELVQMIPTQESA